MLHVTILPTQPRDPSGKLADAELHFNGLRDAADFVCELGEHVRNTQAVDSLAMTLYTVSTFDGLKLIGFTVWQRGLGGDRYVTFPTCQYSVNGERRNFALLRPIADAHAQDALRDLILTAYADYEQTAAAKAQATT